MLLRPVAAELGREDAALLLEHLDTLESLGFSCEDFGGDTVLVRQIPADLDASDVTATLEEPVSYTHLSSGVYIREMSKKRGPNSSTLGPRRGLLPVSLMWSEMIITSPGR